MSIQARALRVSAVLAMTLTLSRSHPLAVEPGVDIASPRVAISQVADATSFQPANLVVEQGEYVRWKHVGATLSHTTTSGSGCVTSGLWSASLTPGTQFTRQFTEPPQSLPYFCIPHCGLGMTGSVKVTSPIALQAADGLGQLDLSWTGGGGLYRVNRSDSPGFVSAGTVVLVPDGGDAGTTFSDTLLPDAGSVLYYLVTNKF